MLSNFSIHPAVYKSLIDQAYDFLVRILNPGNLAIKKFIMSAERLKVDV
jgi:hypothetical protein